MLWSQSSESAGVLEKTDQALMCDYGSALQGYWVPQMEEHFWKDIQEIINDYIASQPFG